MKAYDVANDHSIIKHTKIKVHKTIAISTQAQVIYHRMNNEYAIFLSLLRQSISIRQMNKFIGEFIVIANKQG